MIESTSTLVIRLMSGLLALTLLIGGAAYALGWGGAAMGVGIWIMLEIVRGDIERYTRRPRF